jgi:hypothetical protein
MQKSALRPLVLATSLGGAALVVAQAGMSAGCDHEAQRGPQAPAAAAEPSQAATPPAAADAEAPSIRVGSPYMNATKSGGVFRPTGDFTNAPQRGNAAPQPAPQPAPPPQQQAPGNR